MDPEQQPPDNPPQQPPPSTEDQDEQARVREWHNTIGKKYRNKLNEQFESLQAILVSPDPFEQQPSPQAKPTEDDSNGNPGGSSSAAAAAYEEAEKGTGPAKRKPQLNKAKLLDMARERIEELTKEKEELAKEEEELREGLRAYGVEPGKDG